MLGCSLPPASCHFGAPWTCAPVRALPSASSRRRALFVESPLKAELPGRPMQHGYTATVPEASGWLQAGLAWDVVGSTPRPAACSDTWRLYRPAVTTGAALFPLEGRSLCTLSGPPCSVRATARSSEMCRSRPLRMLSCRASRSLRLVAMCGIALFTRL